MGIILIKPLEFALRTRPGGCSMLKVKLLITFSIMWISFGAMAQGVVRGTGGNGGDMPFPIGRVTDFPSGKIKGVWGAEDLKSRLFRLIPDRLEKNWAHVQMLDYYKKVVALGDGIIGQDQILRATLSYVNTPDKYVHVKIANYCFDEGFELKEDRGSCQDSAMVVVYDEAEKDQKVTSAKYYILQKQKP